MTFEGNYLLSIFSKTGKKYIDDYCNINRFFKLNLWYYKYTVQKIRGTCFWNVCYAPQDITAHPGILPTNPLFFSVQVYKRTLMDSRSFSEHKRKCPNRGETKS